MAIKTTLVGVAVFSETRNNNVNTLKEQMSIPDPAMEVNIPPMKPAPNNIRAFQFSSRLSCQYGVKSPMAQISGRCFGSTTR